MANEEKLESVVSVEFGGGITIIKLKDKPENFCIEDTVRIGPAFQVEIQEAKEVDISFADKSRKNYILIKKMVIVDREGYRTQYAAKTIQSATYTNQ